MLLFLTGFASALVLLAVVYFGWVAWYANYLKDVIGW